MEVFMGFKQSKEKQDMFLITKREAYRKALATTNEGLHFKGQFLPKENFEILGKKVDFIEKAFNYVLLVRYNNKEYFISENLIKTK